MPGENFEKTGKIIGIESIKSYPVCKKCPSMNKLQNQQCTRCKTTYNDEDNKLGFIAKLSVEAEEPEQEETTIKLFNNQLQKLLPDLPNSTEELADMLTETGFASLHLLKRTTLWHVSKHFGATFPVTPNFGDLF